MLNDKNIQNNLKENDKISNPVSMGTITSQGYDYHLKWLLYYICQAKEKYKNDFKVGAEDANAGKFDDLVFIYKDDNGKTKQRLIQIKHRKYKITNDDLLCLPELNKYTPFSLKKYFDSFKNKILKKFTEIQDLIICTTAELENWNDYLVEKSVQDDFFNLGGKLIWFNPKLRGEIIEKLIKEFGYKHNNKTKKYLNIFLKKFMFAVEQPSMDQLEHFIKYRIGKLYYNYIFIEVHNLVKDYKTVYLSREQIEQMFIEAKELQGNGQSFDLVPIYDYKLEFHENTDILKKIRTFLTGNNDSNVLILLTNFPLFSELKICQILKEINFPETVYSDFEYFKKINKICLSEQTYFIIKLEPDNTDDDWLIQSIQNINRNHKVILITDKWRSTNTDIELLNDNTNNLLDFTLESQNVIVKKEIVFQGESVTLDSILSDSIKPLINSEILIKLITNEEINIGTAIKNSTFYVPQQFICKKEIQKSLIRYIEKNRNDFIITRNKNDEISPEYANTKDIVVIFNTANYFTELCEKYTEYNIHWIQNRNNNYVWRKTHGNMTRLKSVVDDDNTAVIINSGPGMGNSTALTRLAIVAKRQNPLSWSVLVILSKYSSLLKEWTDKKIDKKDVLKFLLTVANLSCFEKFNEDDTTIQANTISKFFKFTNNNVTLKNEALVKIKGLKLLEVELFCYCLNNNKMILMFDGFNNILPDFKDQTLQLLGVVQKNITTIVYITTRSIHSEVKLENVLNTFSYELQSFSVKQQDMFLKNYWRHNLKLEQLDENRFCTFTKELFKNFIDSTKDTDRDFFSVPLYIKIIAEIFLELFDKFYNFADGTISDQIKEEIDKKVNFITLYDTFVLKIYEHDQRKFIPYYNQIKCLPIIKKESTKRIKKFIKKHILLSMYALNSKDKLTKFLNEKNWKDINKLLKHLDLGCKESYFIKNIIDNKPKFMHRTLTEYFGALYCYKMFEDESLKYHQNEFQISKLKYILENAELKNSSFLYFVDDYNLPI